MERPERARCCEQRSKNNLSSDHSRGICASWEHEMGEPDLSLNKKVQQQLLAPDSGLPNFFCLFVFLPPRSCPVKSRVASAVSFLPPSDSSGSLKAGIRIFLFLIRSMDSSSNRLVPKLHFCKKIFAAALCVSILLPESGFAKNLWKRALHLKLAEKYDDYEYPLHSHSAHYQKNDRCPPPPQTLPERACEVPSCRSDSECERHKRCCYNGCIYACLESVQPPPVLDWLVQPKPRWLGGNGWLLDGPEEVLQAEACSTTEDGDEPLHCPTGYECHIINPGNTAEGIPNRGQCIKLRGNPDGRNLRHKYYKEYFGSNSNNVLGYVKQQQKHLG